ncbi:hypothetical protein DFH07DRAFT_949231 [Mycena maculata]|uniref:Uncharacterized protein n=1 Tax=Mycena maculata TaxID=230809 RepID=A0AAD7KBI2_9AGAR|nr:hypothetical protein DFH07DRAFT_949231 [Mycena maculata]
MSTSQGQPRQLRRTNMSVDEVVMDEQGVKDRRYYCLPPFRGDRTQVLLEGHAGRYPLHLVAQAHIAGIFDNWPEAKASITNYLDGSHQGCYSEEECIDVWQRLCMLGIHPHAVDPVYAPPACRASPVKKEGGSGHLAPSDPQLLADLKRFCSPILPPANSSPRKGALVAAEFRNSQRRDRVKYVLGAWHKNPFFLANHKDEYLVVAQLKKTGDFYSRMVQLYLKKYGYYTAWNNDPDEGQDIAKDVDPDKDVNDLDPEVAKKRAVYFNKLRAKIGVWYNSKYSNAAAPQNVQGLSFRKLFDKKELDPPAPIKAQTPHYYSRHFYHDHIKKCVEARWQAVSHLPPPQWETTSTINQCWKAEDDGFKAEVAAAIQRGHQAAKEAYKLAVSGETPLTPEEYMLVQQNGAYYMQPFADAIRDRFGWNVVIMMCGPVPEHDGRIEVRR